jgi:hypothetical protein
MTVTDLYRWFDEKDQLLYVGISQSAFLRASQHRSGSEFYPLATKMLVQKCVSRNDALQAEAEAILQENPLFNKARPTGARVPEKPLVVPPVKSIVHVELNDAQRAQCLGKILAACPDTIPKPDRIYQTKLGDEVLIRSQAAKLLRLTLPVFDFLVECTNAPCMDYFRVQENRRFRNTSDIKYRYLKDDILVWAASDEYQETLMCLRRFIAICGNSESHGLHAIETAMRKHGVTRWQGLYGSVEEMALAEQRHIQSVLAACQAITDRQGPRTGLAKTRGINEFDVGESNLKLYVVEGSHRMMCYCGPVALGLVGHTTESDAVARWEVVMGHWSSLSNNDTQELSVYNDSPFSDLLESYARDFGQVIHSLVPDTLRRLLLDVHGYYMFSDTLVP